MTLCKGHSLSFFIVELNGCENYKKHAFTFLSKTSFPRFFRFLSPSTISLSLFFSSSAWGQTNTHLSFFFFSLRAGDLRSQFLITVFSLPSYSYEGRHNNMCRAIKHKLKHLSSRAQQCLCHSSRKKFL